VRLQLFLALVTVVRVPNGLVDLVLFTLVVAAAVETHLALEVQEEPEVEARVVAGQPTTILLVEPILEVAVVALVDLVLPKLVKMVVLA
jgi:hypothetical protein